MKSGVRAVGVAESYRDGAERSTLAGCVVRADRVVDGVAFGQCTVGGADVTDAITTIYRRLDREDVQYVLVAGVALAWYNIVDLAAIYTTVDRPVIAVSFEESDGLEAAIRAAFDHPEERVSRYDALPERYAVVVNGEEVFIRVRGCTVEEGREIVRAFTPEGGRPEPLRIARLAARAGDRYRRPTR